MSKIIETITENEELMILKGLAAEVSSPWSHTQRLRNTTMFLLMLDAGLRIGGVVNLIVPDLCTLNEPVHTVIISKEISKNKTSRTVPLTNRLQKIIKEINEYIWQYECQAGACWCFFTTTPTKHITTRQVERIIKFISKRFINREIHPHILRHTFATRCMRVSSIRIVQALLGHKSLTSTQIYTHPNNIDLKTAIDSLEQGKLPRN